MHSTNKMALYLKASDVFISKPGGLSSTESAAAGVPLVHISPIPGCESRNAEFFAKEGIAVKVENTETELLSAVERLSEPGNAEEMRKRQRTVINQNAAMDICELLETVARSDDAKRGLKVFDRPFFKKGRGFLGLSPKPNSAEFGILLPNSKLGR